MWGSFSSDGVLHQPRGKVSDQAEREVMGWVKVHMDQVEREKFKRPYAHAHFILFAHACARQM